MPVIITRLFSFEGPNIISPQPGVLLQARARRDMHVALRHALKDIAQQVGMVIAALDINVHEIPPHFLISAHFVTPTPELAATAVQYIVDGLNAHELGDEAWDEDEQLAALQDQRRAGALPFAAMQLVAEANQRGVPWFRRGDGMLQFGYGARGYAVDPTHFVAEQWHDRQHVLEQLPWERLGPIPIIAVSGGAAGARVGSALAAAMPGQGFLSRIAARFRDVREILCQPGLHGALLDLEPADLLAKGLPFEQCSISAIAGLPLRLPTAHDSSEIARAVALPLLVTNSHAFIAADPDLLEPASFASCTVSSATEEEMVGLLQQHAKRLFETNDIT